CYTDDGCWYSWVSSTSYNSVTNQTVTILTLEDINSCFPDGLMVINFEFRNLSIHSKNLFLTKFSNKILCRRICICIQDRYGDTVLVLHQKIIIFHKIHVLEKRAVKRQQIFAQTK